MKNNLNTYKNNKRYNTNISRDTQNKPNIKRKRQHNQSELQDVLSDARKFSTVEDVENYCSKISELEIICEQNKKNIKKWETKPILTLTDPKPLDKDTLFSNVPNNDIIKKYFTHVSYPEFITNLNAAWKEAAPVLKGKNYITVGKFIDPDEDNGKNFKSSYWATSLLLKNNPDFQPKDMIDSFNLSSDHLKKLQDVVLVDDATYSGTQMAEIVPTIIEQFNMTNKHKKLNIHLVIPYMSDGSKEIIKENFEETAKEYNIKNKVSLKFYSQQKIDDIEHIELNEKQEVQQFLKTQLKFLTTFDHKIADFESLGFHVAFALKDSVKPVYKIEDNIIDTSVILDKK